MDRHRQIYAWLTTSTFDSQPSWIAEVHAALAVVPSGVEVRATNNLLIPLAARDTVTLVGSNVDKGNWAAVDTSNPQCPISASAIPAYLTQLESQGFRVVAQYGPIEVLHKV
jgi:hypothetical protein